MKYFLRKKKWMAWVIMLTFLFTSIMPSNLLAGNSMAEAAGGDTPAVGVHNPDSVSKNGVTLSKKAKQIGLDEYEVTLAISGGGTEDQKPPLNISLVLDYSPSMTNNGSWIKVPCNSTSFTKHSNRHGSYYTCNNCGADYWSKPDKCTNSQNLQRLTIAQNAACAMIDTLVEKKINAQIAVSQFSYSGKIIRKLTPILNEDGTVNEANVNAIKSSIRSGAQVSASGTNIDDGLRKGNAALPVAAASNPRSALILLTDGVPNRYGQNGTLNYDGTAGTEATSTAGKIKASREKENFELYTVGFAEQVDVLTDICSEPASKYNKTAQGGELANVFNDIINSVLQVLIDGDVTDTMGDEVTLKPGAPITITPTELPKNGETVVAQPSVNASGDIITWDTGAFVNGSATLKYTVKLKDYDNPNELIALNKDATLTYKYWDSANKEYKEDTLQFPVPQVVYETGTLKVTATGLPTDTMIKEQTDGAKIVGRTTEEGTVLTSKFNKIYTSNEVVQNVPEGYELKSVKVTQGGAEITDGTIAAFNTWYNQRGRNGVIDVVKGETTVEYVYGKVNVGYTVEYYYDTVQDTTLTKTGTAPYGTAITEKANGAVSVGSTDYASQLKTGYKYDSTTAPATIGVENSSNVIKVYYVKDDSQKHSVSYTVEYYKDGNLTNTTDAVTDTQWIMDAASVDVTGVNTTNYYGAGYKFVETDPATVPESYSIVAGEASSSHVIKVYYEKDNSQTHSVSYTVEYYKDGNLTNTTDAVTATQWIMDAASVDVTGVNTTNYYGAGYKFVETAPATVPESYSIAAGEASSTDNVIKVYYTPIDYTVTYEYEGNVPDGAIEQLPPVEGEKHVNGQITVKPEPKVDGYVFSGWTVKEPEGLVITDGHFTMPAQNVTLVGSWTLAGNTTYKVNYYYQNDEGSYDLKFTDSLATTTGVLVFADTTPNEAHDITTPSMYQFNPAGRTMNANDNVVNTLVQARVAADGSTVLNVFFDQVYRIVYMYTNGATTTYVINDTGYIYKQDSEFRPPTLDWGAEIGTNFDGVWYDNIQATGEAWATWTIAGSMETVAFDAATNTITLYTTEEAKPVTPFTKGLLNVAKVVNDGGKKTEGTEEFKFELKILEIKQAQQEFAPLSSDEAEKLHHYNSENINAQSANDKAQENLLNAEHKFKGNALTTASALSFVIAADDNTALFGVTTGSEMGWTSYDEWNTYVFEGDGIAELSEEETVLDKMIEFIRIFAEQGRTMPTTKENTKLFMDDMMDYAGVATGSAIMFHHADLYELYDAAATAAMTSAAADKKATALEEFLKEINRWVNPVVKVIFGDKEYALSDYANGDGTYTIPFTLKDKEALGFDFNLTTGSSIKYVITEVDAQGADSTDINEDNNMDNKVDVQHVNKLFVEGTVEVTTDSAIGYTFMNNYKGSTPPPVGPVDPWPPVDPVDPPEVVIPDPEPPLVEPEEPTVDPTEPTEEITDPDVPLIDVPGEEVEIPEPEVPLGDAPKTGDANNAVPFVVLMMAAGLGLVITRRRFN